jgi:cystathionine beta-lyase/cystathionine gamma-synthase
MMSSDMREFEEQGMGLGFATRAVHGTDVPPPADQPLSVPIYQTATFVARDAERMAGVLADPDQGFSYTRYGNPTTAALEGSVAGLEGGVAACAFASGMGAVASVLLTLTGGAGAHVVAQKELYGGSFSLLEKWFPRFGIDVTLVDATDPAAVDAAVRPETKAVYVETIVNPTMTVTDLPAVAAVAARHGVPLVVDNTVASPFLCRPLRYGAQVVVHSSTKYLTGHSDVIGGIAVFADDATCRAARHTMIDLGASPDPFAAWLTLRGLGTLPLRMRAHSDNARAVAELLEAHPAVRRVYWPGLPSHPTHPVAQKILDGPSGFLSFDLPDRAAGQQFVESTRIARLAPSLGGLHTILLHPASTSHRQLSVEALNAAGIGEGMVRVSVGVEDAADLVADFEQALEAVV